MEPGEPGQAGLLAADPVVQGYHNDIEAVITLHQLIMDETVMVTLQINSCVK